MILDDSNFILIFYIFTHFSKFIWWISNTFCEWKSINRRNLRNLHIQFNHINLNICCFKYFLTGMIFYTWNIQKCWVRQYLRLCDEYEVIKKNKWIYTYCLLLLNKILNKMFLILNFIFQNFIVISTNFGKFIW